VVLKVGFIADFVGKVVGHIRVVGRLGRGGMGVVYEGFDETLQRRVALKVVHAEFRLNPEAKARFLREARILSQLDHPKICRVFDFIERDDHDILVLELVDGINLRRALERGLEERQKMDIAGQLLEVLVAVHGAGVIHRDLKPENIMLTSDGEIKVLDFGLARSADEDPAYSPSTMVIAERDDPGDLECEDTEVLALNTEKPATTTPYSKGSSGSQSTYVKTSHGVVLGTAAYMSPEQARGEPATADSDMYSLGLVLQELFGGRRAIDIGLAKEILIFKATRGETLPVENVQGLLKTLIERLKSLEPSARPTAIDAAERFDWIRTAPRRRRRRQLIACAWLVVTLFAFVASFQAVRLSRARKREQLANRFGTEVQRIDSLMRFAFLAPLHDLRDDRERVRRRVAWIQRHLEDVGDWGIGPGLFAIGRGHLALGELEEARTSLQQAWDSGYREPEAAYALGRTLGTLYQRELDRLRFITDDTRRAEERARIETEIRDPAIWFLKACSGAESVQPDFIEGLLALHENRFGDALESAAQCEKGAAWQYEGRLLEGRARFLQARNSMAQGKRKMAAEDFRTAAAAFESAAQIGQSDPRCRTGLCLLWTSVMEMRLYGAGGDLQEAFDNALASCDASLKADHDQPIVLNGTWACFRMLAESRMQGAPNQAAKALVGAREVAETLVAMRPESALAHQELGLTLVLSSILATRAGRDGTGDGRAGVADLERAVGIDPGAAGIWLDLGNAHQYLGAAVEAQGNDPMQHYLEAADAFGRAIEIRPDFVFAFNNLAALELMLANMEQERGHDPRTHTEEAIRNGTRAFELKPDHVYALANIAGANIIKGRYLAGAGKDPEPAFDQARKAAEKARNLNPDFVPVYLYIAEVNLETARYRVSQGRRAGDVVTEGIRGAEEALKRIPGLEDAIELRKDLESVGQSH